MSRNRVRGFTLIELIIVVVIVGILAAIALPTYRQYVLRSHRATAVNALLALSSQEARYYSANNAYTTSLTGTTGLGYAADPAPVPDASTTYYNLSVTSVSANSFTLSAQPVNNQVNDTRCGTFTYTGLGVKGITGTGSVNNCWGGSS